MEQELQLWDDTRSQVIQFYIAKLFRRGNQNKTKLLYHFRIGQIDPETNSLKSVMEILNRESNLEDWDLFSRNLRDIVIGRCENTKFTPREKDIAFTLNRILATPQIETTLSIDGVAYLLRTPEITGHIDLSIRFWTTADLLKKFQLKLQQILQNRVFRTNVEILPEITVNSLYSDDDEVHETTDAEEETEQELTIENDVVKKAKPDTEMLIKVEESVDGDDSVEVEDWEEEDVDEFGGDDFETEDPKKSVETLEINNDKNQDDIEPVIMSEVTKDTDKKVIILETKTDSAHKIKLLDKTQDVQTLFDAESVKINDKLPAKIEVLKKEENSDADVKISDEKNDTTNLKRSTRTPKISETDNKQQVDKSADENKDEEPKKAPKKSVRAKKTTSEKKKPAKKTTAAKKTAAKKPRSTKKDDEEKKTDADDDN